VTDDEIQVERDDTASDLANFDDLWNYSDPGDTRVKFEALLPMAEKLPDQSCLLQLQTQIARTFGLQQNYDSAHKVLDGVESKLTDGLELARVRYLLERGRTINSAGAPTKARTLFNESFELARRIGADSFAADAAHMVAIVAESRDERIEWNLKGIGVVESSTDARAERLLGPLYNNIGWEFYSAGEFERALDVFKRALVVREKTRTDNTVRIARWCIAKTMRALNMIEEALVIQTKLEEEYAQLGGESGYVWEELGELYLIKGSKAKAADYFGKAYGKLLQDKWLVSDQPERIKRLKLLGS